MLQAQNLFPDAYNGRTLDVSAETDSILRELFPECDLPGIYRLCDAWILTCAPSRRPRNLKRFLVNWCKKEAAQVRREHKRDIEVRRELYAG
jgi:hypothetical protein